MAAVILLATSIFMWRAARDQARIATIQRAVAARQAIRANDAAVAAQNALTDSFFRTIGISKGDTLARDEREALWELAQLDRANAVVRNDLLKRWFGTLDAFARVQARGGQGLRAATGLNLEYHRLAIRGASELGLNFAAALENPRETNSARLSSLGEALAALAAEMEPQAAAEVARRGAQRLAATLENTQETDPDQLRSLGDALAALASKMEPQAAAEVTRRGAQGLAAALENPQEKDYARLSGLGDALATLAAKIEPQAAAEVKRRAAQGLAAALENPQERDYTRLTRLRDALAALAAKMEPQAALEIAKRLAAALENPQERDYTRLTGLGDALAQLAAKMEPQAALEIAKGPCGSLGESAGKGYGAACALSALTNSQLYKMRWQVQRKKCSSSRLSSICELALLRKLYERSQVSSLDRGVRLRA